MSPAPSTVMIQASTSTLASAGVATAAPGLAPEPHPTPCTCPLPPLPRLTYTCTRRQYDEWDRAMTGYLFFVGARGILSGRRREPYRRGSSRTGHADHDVIYPPDEVAGDAMPRPDARVQDALVWTAAMSAEWKSWEWRESKARGVILATIDVPIWKQVKGLWCARDMYTHIWEQYGGGRG
ncbi:uncharacterized protein LOC62_02G002963 [Vanrija pseudolonga]|uniref:Uncharacterized protein n=1 Tax=Vanrija pseudolonga TaxID=143232 RepID=A0AAF0Y4V6_9TREE|nr:hypothetical protein LOC62_02G002963 [Vanrija pseudolonga]